MTAEERRLAHAFARQREISGRRSNWLVSLSDSSRRYKAKHPSAMNLEAVEKIIELSQQKSRWGYRLVHATLRQRGHRYNHKRVYRLRREMLLNVPRKPRYKRKHGAQNRRMTAIRPNAVWAFDFVHDSCANGQKLKIFAVKDEFTRESLAIEVDARFRSSAVVATLDRLVVLHGRPAFLRCDNGPEFIAQALRLWAKSLNIELAYTEPGKPWQNGSVESFNSRLRDECLDMEWFMNRAEARVLIEQFRNQYNSERPHSSLNYFTPAAFKKDWQRANLLAQLNAA